MRRAMKVVAVLLLLGLAFHGVNTVHDFLYPLTKEEAEKLAIDQANRAAGWGGDLT
ncbi:hypothetical protein HRbin30_00067 [bacterium HR30]|nr:hypothetical protein HRbin30_00067 [bacterium HR30]